MVSFLKQWLLLALAVVLAACLVPGIHFTAPGLVGATLLLSILNAFVRPILVLLSLPLLVFTLGFFMLIINALLLWWVGSILRGFSVDGFKSAFWGALIISIISILLNSLTRTGDSRIHFRRGSGRPPRDGGGPVIDV
jgi:putative membrane protein